MDMTVGLMADYLPNEGSEQELALVSIEKHVTPEFPPTFLMTGTEDFLKEQAPIMAAKLAKEEVPFIYRFYGDRNTRLPHVFHCDIRSEDAKLCNDEECEFFRKFL